MNARLATLADALDSTEVWLRDLLGPAARVKGQARENCREVAAILRALAEREPVAWRYRQISARGLSAWKLVKTCPEPYSREHWEYQPLYTLPKEADPAP